MDWLGEISRQERRDMWNSIIDKLRRNMVTQATTSTPIDNNGCPLHKTYCFTCGTCNGYFGKDGKPTQPKLKEN